MTKLADEKVLVLDFGSQYAQLIARRVRDQQVYCEIVRHSITADRIRELAPRGLIFSGGPASVYEEGAPRCDPRSSNWVSPCGTATDALAAFAGRKLKRSPPNTPGQLRSVFERLLPRPEHIRSD